MSSKIVALGSEEFTLGFELVGVIAHKISELENLMKTKEIGIIIISQEDYEKESKRMQHKIDMSIKPIVVILSNDDVKGGHLRAAIIRALGVDVMAQK